MRRRLFFISFIVPLYLFSQPEENRETEFIPKNFLGVNFMPQLVEGNFALSTGINYIKELNSKIFLEGDLLYSQQDGMKICDSTKSIDINVFICYSSKNEKLKFIKAPLLIQYKFKERMKSHFTLYCGVQPQFLLMNASILNSDNQHNIFSIALMGGIGYSRRLVNDFIFFSQLRFEYTYNMIWIGNVDNFISGAMVGLMFGKKVKQQ